MKFTAKTLYGLEGVLAQELRELGAAEVTEVNRAVTFTGSKELLYKVNYCSRCALSVLVVVSEFTIRSKDDLYRKSSRIEWSGIMDADTAFSVVPVVHSELFGHTGYPALVLKDAIADYFRDRFNRRPSVDTRDPDLIVNLHISNDRVVISIDSTGSPLFKRGYRKLQGPAPLNEVLAAGLLLLSGWKPGIALYDPMCGSGTILIEAGLMACNIAPGSFRKSFGFMKWRDYDASLFSKLKNDTDLLRKRPETNISGSDISLQAAGQSEENISSAGLSEYIKVRQLDMKEAHMPDQGGYLIFNPPYGLRIKPEEITDLYKMIGSALKHNFPGCKAWIIIPGKELMNHVGLKPKVRYQLYNGSIECIFAGYELYEGSRKLKSP